MHVIQFYKIGNLLISDIPERNMRLFIDISGTNSYILRADYTWVRGPAFDFRQIG